MKIFGKNISLKFLIRKLFYGTLFICFLFMIINYLVFYRYGSYDSNSFATSLLEVSGANQEDLEKSYYKNRKWWMRTRINRIPEDHFEKQK